MAAAEAGGLLCGGETGVGDTQGSGVTRALGKPVVRELRKVTFIVGLVARRGEQEWSVMVVPSPGTTCPGLNDVSLFFVPWRRSEVCRALIDPEPAFPAVAQLPSD